MAIGNEKQTYAYVHKKNNLLKKMLIASIILVLFRLPLFGILPLLGIIPFIGGMDIREFARFTFILPFLVALFYFLRRGRIKKYPVQILIIFTIMVGLFFMVQMAFFSDAPLNEIVNVFALFHFFMIFPLLLINLGLEKEDYKYIIDKIAFIVIWVGGTLLILEWVGYRLDWFTSEQVTMFIGDFYSVKNHFPRPIGILADPAGTGILLAACTGYYFVQKIIKYKHHSNQTHVFQYKWNTIVIGVISVFASGSLTTIFIFSSTAMLITLMWVNSFYKIFYAMIAVSLFSIIFYLSPSSNYLSIYLNDVDKYIPLFLPTIPEFQSFPFWGYYEITSYSSPGEFHIFNTIFTYGLLTFLPVFILMHTPLLKIIGLSPMRIEDKAPMILCLIFLLSNLHYGGLERWGNNFIYTLAVIMLFKKPNRLTDQTISRTTYNIGPKP